jgi:tRNA pseudouridine55 synthase
VGAVDGLLYVDKPAGVTSHDVVGVVRRAARTKRVGHAGTLDPFATGLLVLGLGQCTRLLPHLVGEPKVYDAWIRFGHESDTDDATGSLTRSATSPQFGQPIVRNALDAAMQALTGDVEQRPPAFSAKHVNGERAYSIARRGEVVDLPPVRVTVHSWQVQELAGEDLRVRITCGGGTYIRALARDLGRLMHSAAHCAGLRRVASGPASVDDATALHAITPGSIADGIVPLRSPLSLLGDIAHEPLDAAGIRDLVQGRAIAATQPGRKVAFVHASACVPGAAPSTLDVLGVGERRDGEMWQPRVVLVGGGA